MPPSTIEFLKHIRDEIEFLVEIQVGLSLQDFLQDTILQRAVTRSLEIIGEATKQIDPEFTKQYSEIPWRSMAQMRDKLVHHYFGVDYYIVWDILVEEIPLLRTRIFEAISDLEE